MPGKPAPDWFGGTLAYMAPEQRRAWEAVSAGQPLSVAVDGRADVYALGLLELTGTAEVMGSQAFVIFELLIVATFYYLLLTTLWGYVQSWIENRLDPNRNIKVELGDKKGWTERMLGFGSSRTGGGTLVSGR